MPVLRTADYDLREGERIRSHGFLARGHSWRILPRSGACFTKHCQTGAYFSPGARFSRTEDILVPSVQSALPYCHGPPGGHFLLTPVLETRASVTGFRNVHISSATRVRLVSGSSSRERRRNADQRVRTASSSVNFGVSATGRDSGISVLRRANVARMASERTAPSNANSRAMYCRSKKSFIRLFVIPSATIAWYFSETTASHG